MKRWIRLLSLLCCACLLLTLLTACKPNKPSGTDGTSLSNGTTASSGGAGNSSMTPGGNKGSSATGGGKNTATGGGKNTTTGGGKNTATGGGKNTTTQGGSSSGAEKPADVGTIIPAGYGTNAWKPFGTSKVFTDKAINTNFSTHATTQLKTVNGRTRFYVNGKEDAPIMYFGAFQSGKTDVVMSSIGHVLDAGANYIFVDVHINVSNANLRYAGIKTQLEDVLYEYPDAYLIVRYTPWASADFYGLDQGHSITYPNGKKPGQVSVASDEWAEAAIQQTREMIAYLSKYKEVASRIIGYTPLVYNSGEWFSMDYWEGPIDVSPVNTAKFREWLRYRYDNDVNALRKAWGNTTVTFDTAAIPTKIAGFNRNANDNGKLFQLESKYRASVDYVLYHCDIMAYRIEQFARAVKLETNDKSLFIAFYGYYTELFSSASGHFNMDQLLNCDDIDMIAAPVNYENRNEGGNGISMTYPNSVNAHNKIWMDESDYRSYFTTAGNGSSEIKTEKGLFEVMRREMGRLMVEGSGTWWADIAGLGWFNDKEFWVEVEKLSNLYVKYNQIAGKSGYDVAFILDEAGSALSGSPWNHLWQLLRVSRHQMASSGLNFSAYTMNDLLDGKVNADVLVMTTCYSLTAAQQQKLQAQVHKSGRTVLWNLGFGELSASQIKSLTGMEFTQVSGFNRRSITFRANSSLNFTGNSTLLNGTIDPVYKVKTDTGVTVLGSFDDGTPALAAKKVGNSTQVFYAGNTWNVDLLQGIAAMGGAHVYLDSEDVYYGNDSLAVIHTKTAGQKKITLPKKSDVYCYFTGKWYTGVTEITLNLDKNTTEYFFIGSQKELKAAGIG